MTYIKSCIWATLGFAIFGCTYPVDKPGAEKTVTYRYEYPVWHYVLADSFTISMEVDTAFHPSEVKAIWDDHTASFSLASRHSLIVVSYYALSGCGPLNAQKEGITQKDKIKDAYKNRIIEPYKVWYNDILDGVSTLSYDLLKKELVYTGGNCDLLIEFHIRIICNDNIGNPEDTLQVLLESFRFEKKAKPPFGQPGGINK